MWWKTLNHKLEVL